MKHWILDNMQLILSAGSGGFFGWLFGRKKQKAEIKHTEVETLVHMDEAYNKLAASMNSRFDLMQQEINTLHKENLDLKEQVYKLHKENVALKKMIDNK